MRARSRTNPPRGRSEPHMFKNGVTTWATFRSSSTNLKKICTIFCLLRPALSGVLIKKHHPTTTPIPNQLGGCGRCNAQKNQFLDPEIAERNKSSPCWLGQSMFFKLFVPFWMGDGYRNPCFPGKVGWLCVFLFRTFVCDIEPEQTTPEMWWKVWRMMHF